jgi:hypothetical protein
MCENGSAFHISSKTKFVAPLGRQRPQGAKESDKPQFITFCKLS